MLDSIIQSKTRLKLFLSFFLNPSSAPYLRGLAQEFAESTNSVRVELNLFEEAGLIQNHHDGYKKMYQVNTNFPMFNELQMIAFKYFGIDNSYLTRFVKKAEELIGQKIRTFIYEPDENVEIGFPRLLIYEEL